jgi:hypothetical protein
MTMGSKFVMSDHITEGYTRTCGHYQDIVASKGRYQDICSKQGRKIFASIENHLNPGHLNNYFVDLTHV